MTRLLCALGALALAGCSSYTIVQSSVFSDNDGVAVLIEYGRAGSDHVNTFIAPNGKEMEFKSKLMVRAHFPDLYLHTKSRGPDGRIARNTELLAEEDTLVAWQCMNALPTGTMYMTDDEEWKVLVKGFSVNLFRRLEDGRYREVYAGILCDTPGEALKRDERWKEQLPVGSGREYKRSR